MGAGFQYTFENISLSKLANAQCFYNHVSSFIKRYFYHNKQKFWDLQINPQCFWQLGQYQICSIFLLSVRYLYGILFSQSWSLAQDFSIRWNMNDLGKVLAEYHKYLILRKLAKAEHVPYLVRWVKEFLQFARDKTGHKFEAVIEMFRRRRGQPLK